MNSRWRLIVVLMVIFPLAALAQDATSRPSQETAAPTSRPQYRSRYEGYRNNNNNGRGYERRSTSSTPTLPAIYDEVSSRNIFIKGDQRPPPVVNTPVSVPSGPYQPAPSQLYLTGVSLEDNRRIAFLEDKQAYTSREVKIGDDIANGKIVNITIDALDYKDRNGNTVRVRVGFNLAGESGEGVSIEPTAGSSTQPASSAPRAPGESMIDYLRRRRAAGN
jgi:hypothetical protein